MGFLDKLRGGGDTTLAIEINPGVVAPGGQVTVRFDVAGELDDKARGVRVGVRGEGKFLVRERDRDADGDVETREVWRSIQLHEEEHHYPAQLGPGQAVFTLPADAPPSSPNAVEWQAFARVDRERGLDKVERRDIAVRESPEHMPTARAPQQTDDGLTIDALPTAAREGETISGHLTVNLADETKVTAVRIRLHRRCTYVAEAIRDHSIFGNDLLGTFVFGSSTSRITRDEKVAEVDLSGKREFQAGAVEQVPFSIQVPAGPGPTTSHPHAQVEWRLEAVLDRRLRGDLSVDTPLIVY
jgi:hypothetical protein